MRGFALIVVAALAVSIAGCESTDTTFDPLLVTDTAELAAPTAGLPLPSALDITVAGTSLNAGRFPEQLSDAGEWDMALRRIGDELHLVPAGVVGLTDFGGRSYAAITEALTGRSLEQVRQVPGGGALSSERSVPLRPGEVYVVRSRRLPCGISASERYAKIRPLEIDLAEERVRLEVVLNNRCADQRLAEED